MGESPLRLAVFDLDGTLVDSQHTIISSMRAGFKSEGLMPPEPVVVRSVIGMSLDAAIERINPGVRGLQARRVAEGFKHHAHAAQDHGDNAQLEPLMPGARGALDRLESAGMLLAIATGKGRGGADFCAGSAWIAEPFRIAAISGRRAWQAEPSNASPGDC
jgi:phosphoglycolate phosphatase